MNFTRVVSRWPRLTEITFVLVIVLVFVIVLVVVYVLIFVLVSYLYFEADLHTMMPGRQAVSLGDGPR